MEKTSKLKQPGIFLLICLVGFPQISETIFTPSLPQIASSYNVSIGTAQLTLSVYFFAFALGVFCWGWCSDIIGRRRAMNYGILVYVFGSILCYVSPSIVWLLVARFIQAFGASTGSVTTQTILRESYSGEKRHSLFAKISAALAFTPAIGPLIGGFVGERLGFKAVFLTLVIMGAAIFLYSFLCLPETLIQSNQVRPNLIDVAKRLLTNSRVVSFGLIIGGINGVLFSYYAEAPFIFIEKFQLSQSTYGFLGIMIALATIIGSSVSNYWLKTKEPEWIIKQGLGIALLSSCYLAIVSSIIVNYSLVDLILLILGIFIMLIGTGIALPNCLSLALVDFKDVIGTAGALFSLGYYLLVSLITFGMSVFHTGSIVAMPIYFMVMLIVMYGMGMKFISPKIVK